MPGQAPGQHSDLLIRSGLPQAFQQPCDGQHVVEGGVSGGITGKQGRDLLVRTNMLQSSQQLRDCGRAVESGMGDLSCPAFSGQGILRLFTRLPAFPAARP